MGALSIRQVRKTFGPIEILKGIDIDIEAGEFLILVGPSGCGKSTLLNMIAGLDVPTSGSIHIGDRDVTHVPSKDRDIAMVFQSYALYPNMNVAQNIAFALEMRKVPKPQRDEAVQRVAKMLQIGHLLDRKPGAGGGGGAGPPPATPSCSCSTSRCRTWTPSCAWRCAPRSSCCTSARRRPRCTSPTTRWRP
jgi:multiple sugar transport system ATP-binding protein